MVIHFRLLLVANKNVLYNYSFSDIVKKFGIQNDSIDILAAFDECRRTEHLRCTSVMSLRLSGMSL